jgi:hypothetical protein
MAIGAKVIPGQSYVTYDVTRLRSDVFRTIPDLRMIDPKVKISKTYNGYSPIIKDVMPMVAVPLTGYETINVSTVKLDVGTVNANVVTDLAVKQPAIPLVVGLTGIIMLIMRLALSAYQKQIVKLLLSKGVPQGVAVLIALTAPMLLKELQYGLPTLVTLYRSRHLIGTMELDDWKNLSRGMRTEERNLWRARAN